MKENIPSIRSQLIRWLTLPLAIFTFILFIYIYLTIKDKVTAFFDNRLLASAKSIEQSIGIANSKLFVDMPDFSIDFLSSHDKGLVYYSVVDENDKLLIGHKYLFVKRILKKGNYRFYYTTYDGTRLRTVSYKTSLNSAGKIYNAYITIAETTEERDENINHAISLLLIIMSIVILSSVSITVIAVSKGLKPLNKLKRIIKKRDKRDLEPLIFDAPKEVEDIVNSINLLLERSRDTIDYIEHFNSDVSHQLRTPLAEMKVRLELLYDKKDKDFISLNRLLDNMTHITEQLLLYAKTNPNTLNLKRFKRISLNQLCKDYSLKTAPKVFEKGFDFAFEDLNEQVHINCDSIMLESLMDNLINNAIHYAVDVNGKAIGTIYISLQRHNNTVWLNIKDEGSGVNKKDIHNIFERHYRTDTAKQGSGLGLSIVKQIATLHEAKVLAQNENGLKVSIIFNVKKTNLINNHTS